MSETQALRLGAVLLTAGLLTACGGEDSADEDTAAPASTTETSSTAPAAEEPAAEPAEEAAGESTATVTLAGMPPLEFADDGGPRNFCSNVGPSLQATLASIDGEGDLQVFLIQSDADLGDAAADNEPSVDLEVPSGTYIAGASSLAGMFPTEPVTLTVSGKTASGTVTFTTVGSGEKVDAELELSCA